MAAPVAAAAAGGSGSGLLSSTLSGGAMGMANGLISGAIQIWALKKQEKMARENNAISGMQYIQEADENRRVGNRTFGENQRQFDTSFAENQRQFDATFGRAKQNDSWTQYLEAMKAGRDYTAGLAAKTNTGMAVKNNLINVWSGGK
jgi:hypothetical protein